MARQILLSSMEAAGNTGKSSNGVGEDEVISDPPNID